MKPQSIAVLPLALVCGISAAVGLRTYLQSPSALGDLIAVVVPAVVISRNAMINATMLHTKNLPRDVVPDGAFSAIEDVVERSALTALARNEPILNARLSPKGQRGLAALIPKGMRGYTISIPSISAYFSCCANHRDASFVAPCCDKAYTDAPRASLLK